MSKKHSFKKPDYEVHIVDNLLPPTSSIITGDQTPRYIVIHEVSLGTGRSPKNYNMEHYKNTINKFSENGRTVGYHYLVGDKEIYQFVPDNKSTDHCGTAFGNHNSIGIERLICDGIDYEIAVHNQAKLAATLMLKYNIPIENVYTHKHMQLEHGSEAVKNSPKQCPQRLLAGFRGNIEDFKNEIKKCFLHGWFFKESLSKEQIAQIPNFMEIAKKKQQKEN